MLTSAGVWGAGGLACFEGLYFPWLYAVKNCKNVQKKQKSALEK